MTTKPYRLTDPATVFFLGRHVEDARKPVWLTDEEAAYELQIQSIRPWVDDEQVGEATGEERVAIPAIADGVMREAFMGDPDAPDAPPAEPAAAPAKPRSKKR